MGFRVTKFDAIAVIRVHKVGANIFLGDTCKCAIEGARMRTRKVSLVKPRKTPKARSSGDKAYTWKQWEARHVKSLGNEVLRSV